MPRLRFPQPSGRTPRLVLLSLAVLAALSLALLPRLVRRPRPTADVGRPAPRRDAGAERERAEELLAKLPLSFEANVGQVRGGGGDAVKFVSRGPGYNLFLTANEAVLSLDRHAAGPKQDESGRGGVKKQARARRGRSAVVRMSLAGANPRPRVAGGGELPGKSNYFIGRDRSKWRANVANFSRVDYREVYPGVDLVYYGNQRQLEYDFRVAPGADPRRIQLNYTGAERLEVEAATGDLVLHVAGGGELRQHRPVTYQEIGGGRKEIAARYRLAGRRSVAFEIGEYDPTLPLVIDPVLTYATYFGGDKDDDARSVFVDSAGMIYLTGDTNSSETTFPVAGVPFDGTHSGGADEDVFVSKLDPTQTGAAQLVYSTYLGAGGDDHGFGIAADTFGNAYVVGETLSGNSFPTQNGYRTTAGGVGEGFLTKLDGTGSNLLYSTYVGGGGIDEVTAVALDASGNAYLTGKTTSTAATFIIKNGFQTIHGGGRDAFFVKIDPAQPQAADTLVYSTYVGGSGEEGGTGTELNRTMYVTADQFGRAYLVTSTTSSLAASTPLDATADAYQPNNAGSTDAYVVRIDPSLVGAPSRTYATYFGGAGRDHGVGVAVDAAGVIHFAGDTRSTNLPVKNAYQATCSCSSSEDAILVKLDPSQAAGSQLLYSTYFGGALNDDVSYGVALGSSGGVYLMGRTATGPSDTFPLRFPFQTERGGVADIFVAKFFPAFPGSPSLSYSSYVGGTQGGPGDNGSEESLQAGNPLAVGKGGDAYMAFTTVSSDFPVKNPFQGSFNGGGSDGALVRVSLGPGTIFTVNSALDTSNGACEPLGTGDGCTLREAINDANANVGTDTVAFEIPGPNVHTIAVGGSGLGQLPAVTDAVLIYGYSQPGSAPNTLPPPNAGAAGGNNATPLIEINGSAQAGDLFRLDGGTTTLRGLVINRAGGNGINIQAAGGGSVVEGCFVGTNSEGTSALANGDNGVRLDGAPGNRIGGSVPEAFNVISGNASAGVFLTAGAPANTIQGNQIGTNAPGTAAVPNGFAGVIVKDSPSNQITLNHISGNVSHGVEISGAPSGGTQIQVNRIGPNAAGTAAIANGGDGVFIHNAAFNTLVGGIGFGNNISGNTGAGVRVSDSGTSGNVIQDNTVGLFFNGVGYTPLPNAVGVSISAQASGNRVGFLTDGGQGGNLIGFNSGHGVEILTLASNNFVQGNKIGTDGGGGIVGNSLDGVNVTSASNNLIGGATAPFGNRIAHNLNGVVVADTGSAGNGILSNTIFNNTDLDIDLGADGPTANDPNDTDGGANNAQNFPVVTSASVFGGSLQIRGTLDSTPNTTFTLQFFGSGPGIGNGILLHTARAATDGGGASTFSFSAPAPFGMTAGDTVTATATDPANNTSELSATAAASSVAACGAANFAAPVNLASAAPDPVSAAAGDFNNDGRLDIATANEIGDTITLFIDDGAGGFGAGVNFPVGDAPRALVVADFNNDGRLDAATANLGSGNVTVLLGDGAGGFPSVTNYPFLVAPTAMAAADFNGDGFLDLAVANDNDNNVGLLLNDGAGGFTDPPAGAGAGADPFAIATGDLNGDGFADIVTADNAADTVTVSFGDGALNFSASPITLSAGDGPTGVVLVDLTGDGVPDIVTANSLAGTVSVHLNDGNGTFAAPSAYAAGNTPSALAAGDFNGDGFADIATANRGEDKAAVLFGTGVGSLALPAVLFDTADEPVAIVAADFDRDGKPDLATANVGADNVSVLVNSCVAAPAATFTVNTTADPGDGSCDPVGTGDGCTLREAINDANGFGGTNTIAFQIGTGVQTISPLSELPQITDPVIIDGTTQPGFAGAPLVELKGAAAGGSANGLSITAGSSTVRGLVINGFGGSGVLISNGAGTAVLSNSIHSNAGLGIDLSPNGVTPNDLNDFDTGANDLQNFPVITAVTVAGGNTTIQGTLDNRPSIAYRVEFFSTPACDPSGNGEGKTFLGAVTVNTNDEGDKTFDETLTGVVVTVGHSVTATASDPAGSTSEFSACFTAAAPTYTVNTTADTGDGVCTELGTGDGCTLREAIGGANASVGTTENIAFQIPAAADPGCDAVTLVCTIRPASALPTITDPVVIDGYTQAGAGANTLAVGNNAALKIFLDGNGLAANGLNITAGSSIVRGLVISRFGAGGAGIRLATGGGNTVEGCYIGTDVTGTIDQGNTADGIVIVSSSNNQIGGATPAARNLISGNNSDGVEISGGNLTGNVIRGNYIGTNAAGTAALGNANGVNVTGTPNITGNIVGGTTATPGQGAGNVISGNTSRGIVVNGAAVTGTVIQGNIIGLSANGTADLGNTSNGINVASATSTAIGGAATTARNVISGNNAEGILLTTADNTTIQNNYVGTDITGSVDLGNTLTGVVVTTSANVAVGTAGAGNLISGNNVNGVGFTGVGAGSTVRGNLIGTDAAGVADLGNAQIGVRILTTAGVVVGGTTPAERNVISGNDQGGVELMTANNVVRGNYIGTQADGVSARGNGIFGINVPSASANNNQIGGTGAGEGNRIAFNAGDGVSVGNLSTFGVSVRGNSIHSNGSLANEIGIDLGVNGVTANDAGDPDTGANNLQNFPVLTSVMSSGGNTTITGTLNSTASTMFSIEFFSNPTCDASGNGEGRTFLGSTSVTTDGSGNATINAMLTVSVSAGESVTATATDPANNTSEFSACRQPPVTTLSVTNTADSGAGSLRQAITDSNNTAGVQTITFNIGTGAQTINLLSGLPAISQPVIIDGATQPGYAGTPLIELNGATAGAASGFLLNAGSSTIHALVINRFAGSGIVIQTGGGNTVTNCYIGTNAAGTAALANNQNGIAILSANNTIGGTSAAARNLISGNGLMGINLSNAGATGNTVQGNLIGTDVTGTSALGNTVSGIQMTNSVANNTIGGTSAGAANIIAFNGQDGVHVNGNAATGNRISGNSIHSNGTIPQNLGIDLIGTDGTTANDAGDGDTGGNNLQNFPVLTSAVVSGGTTTVAGTLNSTPSTTYRVEFFSTPACDASGNGEGQTFAGFADVMTDGAGNAAISTPLGTALTVGHVVTATATDPAGNTSEFSACRAVAAPASSDLALAVSDSPDPGTTGNAVTYVVSVTNNGPSPATGVGVTVTPPAGVTVNSATPSQGTCPAPGGASFTCGLGALANGATATVTVVLTPTQTGPLSFTASVAGGEPDPIPANNSETETTTVNGPATNVSWINAAGGNWNTAANWQDGTGANRVPTAADNVIFTLAGTYTITLDVNAPVSSLTLGDGANSPTLNTQSFTLTLANASSVAANATLNLNGTLAGGGSLTVAGTLNWRGTMSGAGQTNISAGATLNLDGNQPVLARTLNNSGTANYNVVSSMVFTNGTFNNLAGALFDLKVDKQLLRSGGAGQINNAGTLRKSAGALTTSLNVPLANTGTVEVQSGTLSLDGGGTNSNVITAAAGASVGVSGFTLAAGSSLTAPTLSFSGTATTQDGTLNITETTTVGGTVTFNGNVQNLGTTLDINGTAVFNSNDISAQTINLQGSLQGSANVSVPAAAGTFNWRGQMAGTGVTDIPAGATLNIDGNQPSLLRALNNSGTTIYAPVSSFVVSNGTFNNLAGALFEVRADKVLFVPSGTAAFNNAGTFRKTTTAGVTEVRVPFNNTGAVDNQSGTLNFTQGGASSGSFTAAAPGTAFVFEAHNLQAASSVSTPALTFVGTSTVAGAVNVTGTTTFTGAATFTGNVQSLGQTINIAGTAAFNSNDITAAAITLDGTLTGSANVSTSAAGTFNWRGQMLGTGQTNIPAGATLNIDGSQPRLGRALNNSGTANYNVGTSMNFVNGTFNNLAGATLDLKVDKQIFRSAGTGVINNAGLLVKTAGAGETHLNVAVANTGTVESRAGTLRVGGQSYVQTAGSTLLNGGQLASDALFDLQGGELRGAGTFTGNLRNGGTVRPGLSPGCLTVAGNYEQLAAGALDLEIGGATACTEFDRLVVTGTAALAGAASATLVNNFQPAFNNTFQVLTFASRAGTFSTVNGPFTAQHNATNVTLVSTAAPAAVFNVTSTNDSGAGSLRQAILDANAAPGTQTIGFNLAGAGPQTIAPTSALPSVTEAVVIDGYTQPGASANTQTAGDDRVLLVVLSGASLGGLADGLSVTAGGTTVRGLVINGFGGSGVVLSGGSGSVVEGNFIGTNATGTAGAGGGLRGVYVSNANNNTVGGTAPAARNLLSGHSRGVEVLVSTGTVISGNRIGTDAAGTGLIPNTLAGVLINAANGNTVGTPAGASASAGNLISGNAVGVMVTQFSANNLVAGNLIGTDAAGTAALANASHGVVVQQSSNGNTIGGAAAQFAPNRIAFNGGDGVLLDTGANNRVSSNSFKANAGLGVRLTNGANGDPAAPAITSATASGGQTVVQGTLSGAANTAYTVEFFSSPACDPSGAGEGETYLGSTVATTDAAGAAAFNATLPGAVTAGSVVTATATNPAGATSQFSACATAAGPAASANLALVISDSPDPVTVGAALTYTIGVSNAGPDAATNVTVTDTLPAGVTLVSAVSPIPGASCAEAAGTITCNLGTLNAGANVAGAVSIVVNAPAAPATLGNTASVASAVGDPDTTDNSATATTTVTAAPTYTITGRVADNANNNLPGVTLTLTGSQSAAVQSDANGNYSFAGLQAGGNYTVTPSLANYTFAPASRAFNNLSANQTADFTGTLNTFQISGRVGDGANNPLAGVTVTLSGSQAATATTDAGGNYAFANLSAGGNYTVTPSLANYGFAPPSRTFAGLSANQTADFTGTPGTFSITGRVSDAGNNALAGATLTLSGSQSATATADAGGNYSFGGLAAGGNYTVTPGLSNYTFAPASRAFNSLSANQTGDFAGTLNTHAISGRIVAGNNNGLAGVAVALTGAQSGSTQTDAGGNYSFAGLAAGGSYTVTPSFINYTFAPPSRTFNNLSASQTGDFTGTLNTFQIGGRVSDAANNNLAGVTVTLTGAQSGTATTDANGNYSFANLAAGGNYTVTPSRANFTFAPPARTFDGLNANQTADFAAAVAVVTIAGRVTDENAQSVAGVTVTLTDGAGRTLATTTTDALGNYSFGAAVGGDYTVTPARAGQIFAPPVRLYEDIAANQTGDFTALDSFAISGNLQDLFAGANSNRTRTLAAGGGVIVTLSGTRSGTTVTDAGGNYTFANLPRGGDYRVTPENSFRLFNPPFFSFPDLGGNSSADFGANQNPSPTPTPPIREEFSGPARDPNRFSLGTLTQPPGATDELVTVVQQGGKLVVTPRANFTGLSFNGYVTVNSVNFTDATASIAVDQIARNGAQTIFSVGRDEQNFFRFVAQEQDVAAPPAGKSGPVVQVTLQQLILQARIAGVFNNLAITYDPVAHKYWRFRHDTATSPALLKFEASPSGQDGTYVLLRAIAVPGEIGSLSTEMGAGTAGAVQSPGQAVFDNLNVVPPQTPVGVGTLGFPEQTITVAESAGSVTVRVRRAGGLASVSGVELASEPFDNQPCATADGKARARCDFATTFARLRFAPGETEKSVTIFITDDVYAEGTETFRLALGNSSLGFGIDAPLITVRITDDDAGGAPNPVNVADYFVRQQYRDFLSREPDAAGNEAWTNVLLNCAYEGHFGPGKSGSDPTCDRILVSSGFYRSDEFHARGFYAYRFYDAALGRLPLYEEFLADMQGLAGPQTPAQQEANRRAFVEDFMSRGGTAGRPSFANLYGNFTTGAAVDALLARANVSLPNRNALVADLEAGRRTPAETLRLIAESEQISARFYNRGFVAMQYFGYLQRDPEPSGFNAWLGVLDSTGDFRTMIFGFLYSAEYQSRFGPTQ